MGPERAAATPAASAAVRDGLTFRLRSRLAERGSTSETGIACITVLLTYRCPAACAHCVFECDNTRTATVDGEVARRLIEAASRQSPPPALSFSGGEPFLQRAMLSELMAFGKARGMESEVVTSCAWIRDRARARKVLADLARRGLSTFCASYDRFHAAFIPAARVRAGVLAALEVGLRVVLNTIVAGGGGEDAAGELSRRLDLSREVVDRCFVNRLATVPAGRARTEVRDYRYREAPPAGGCAFSTQVVTLSPYGLLYPCCGSVVGEAPEAAGLFVHDEIAGKSVDEIAGLLETLRRDLFFRLLESVGPWGLLRELRRRNPRLPLRGRYTGPCDACLELTRHPAVAAAMQELLTEYEARLNGAVEPGPHYP